MVFFQLWLTEKCCWKQIFFDKNRYFLVLYNIYKRKISYTHSLLQHKLIVILKSNEKRTFQTKRKIPKKETIKNISDISSIDFLFSTFLRS